MEIPPKPDEMVPYPEDNKSAAEEMREQIQRKEWDLSDVNELDLLSVRQTFDSAIADTLTVSLGCQDPQIIANRKREFHNSTDGLEGIALFQHMTDDIVKARCKEVESILRERDVPFGPVAAGASHVLDDSDAYRHHVFTTDASVIILTEALISFCLIVSKIFALSLIHTLDGNGVQACFDHRKVIANIQANASLLNRWKVLFEAYGRGAGPGAVKHEYIEPPASATAYQFLLAMERFAIAHEYGHHVMQHGKCEEIQVRTRKWEREEFPSGWGEELQADMAAISVCWEFGNRAVPPDLVCMSAAGAVLLLKCLECVKRAEQVLLTGSDEIVETDSHPPLSLRLGCFDALHEHPQDDGTNLFKNFRDNTSAIVDGIWELLRPSFIEMHKSGVRPLTSDDGGWLPG
jgi:hypothetical protein